MEEKGKEKAKTLVGTLCGYGNGEYLQKDVGKTILSRERSKKGKITGIVWRHCAVCGYRPTYSVKWEDGRRTFPCPKGCENEGDMIHIE